MFIVWVEFYCDAQNLWGVVLITQYKYIAFNCQHMCHHYKTCCHSDANILVGVLQALLLCRTCNGSNRLQLEPAGNCHRSNAQDKYFLLGEHNGVNSWICVGASSICEWIPPREVHNPLTSGNLKQRPSDLHHGSPDCNAMQCQLQRYASTLQQLALKLPCQLHLVADMNYESLWCALDNNNKNTATAAT